MQLASQLVDGLGPFSHTDDWFKTLNVKIETETLNTLVTCDPCLHGVSKSKYGHKMLDTYESQGTRGSRSMIDQKSGNRSSQEMYGVSACLALLIT